MWTQFVMAVMLLFAVTTTLLFSQWQLLQPTGNRDRDRSRLERALSVNPSFLAGMARPRLGETCLKQSEEALSRREFPRAAEPLVDLVQRARQGRKPTGYEQEAERRLQRLPDEHLAYAEALLKEGNPAEARACCGEVVEAYPWAPDSLRARAGELEGDCRLAEAVKHLHDGAYAEALQGVRDLVASGASDRVKEEGRALVLPAADQAVRQLVMRGQIDAAFDLLENVRESVKARPDMLDRLAALQESVWVQVFGETMGREKPHKLPAPVYAGPPQPDAPSMVTVRVKNATGYPLRVIASAGTLAQQRKGITVSPGQTGRLILPPGQHWQKASCPTAPGVRPYFGSVELLEAGTYVQTFVVTKREL